MRRFSLPPPAGVSSGGSFEAHAGLAAISRSAESSSCELTPRPPGSLLGVTLVRPAEPGVELRALRALSSAAPLTHLAAGEPSGPERGERGS